MVLPHVIHRHRHRQRYFLSFLVMILVWVIVIVAGSGNGSANLRLVQDLQLFEKFTEPIPFIVVAPTFYKGLEETRYKLGVEACRQAAANGISLILVDGSAPAIRKGLELAGYNALEKKNYVQVVPQKSAGKKGAALREAINLAYRGSRGFDPENAIIAFQELEKVDLFRHWRAVFQFMQDSKSDVVPVRREDECFRKYYPLEQYYAETFGNMYLDSLGKSIGLPALDWTSGPVAFRRKYTKFWLDYPGEIWDSQIVPYVRAYKAGATVASFEVEYKHRPEMKHQEEGQMEWNEKRLMQLNFLKDTLKKEILKH